jgi:L-rhamnose mutarotase
MQKFCLILDLKNDANAIAAYDAYHKKVWPEILESITKSGITNMEIYRVENRLVMTIEATDEFSFAKKTAMDCNNAKVEEWETLMNTFQQKLPFTKDGEKWVLLQKIFELKR